MALLLIPEVLVHAERSISFMNASGTAKMSAAVDEPCSYSSLAKSLTAANVARHATIARLVGKPSKET